MRISAIIPAAGKGTRLSAKVPKPYLRVHGVPLLVHTLRALYSAMNFYETVVVVDPNYLEKAQVILKRWKFKHVKVVSGGKTRAESVGRGLHALDSKTDYVLVHDAARPLVSRQLVLETVRLAGVYGAAIAAVPISSTVKRVSKNKRSVVRTQDRRFLYLAQTPQVFRFDLLTGRYRILGSRAFAATDEAALFDGSRVRIRVSEGQSRNIKVTTQEDLESVKYYLAGPFAAKRKSA